MKVRDFFEARRETKTKTHTQIQDDPFLRAFGTAGAGKQAPARVEPEPRPQQRQELPRLQQAGAERTRQRVANLEMPAGAAERMAAIHQTGLADDDIGVVPDGPETPGTSLATISTAVARATDINPDWHQVRNLPGYLQQPIRALGRQVFGAITRTPVENIQVLANFGTSGEPNTAREINAVAGWLRAHGERDTDGEYEFQQTIPDYTAEFHIYKAGGMTFMLVKDFAGRYIYSWPSTDEERLEGPQDRIVPQLQRR
jgi:hypothetical protein